MNTPEQLNLRPIRSFVLRQGRITLGQNAALEQLWPIFGLDMSNDFNALEAFGRVAPLILEIGFGNGESLAQMALESRDKNFLGIEVHRPGVGHLLLKIQELGLDNVRMYCADAVEVIRSRIAPNSLDAIQVFFPDPWHKKRHHKRRLVNAEFVSLAVEKLTVGGILHCATDWEEYAGQMLKLMEASPFLVNLAGQGSYSERPASRPPTKFERRGQRLGHGVWDLLFEKIDVGVGGAG
ncbi:MAG: tRNA (guanosine(46)-N7)-methyltransferase TrmB [Candidatus Methylumidiphilus sp.]